MTDAHPARPSAADGPDEPDAGDGADGTDGARRADEVAAGDDPSREPDGDTAPGDGAAPPDDESADDAGPVDDAPVDDAPVDDAPVDDAPVDDASAADEAPADDAGPVDDDALPAGPGPGAPRRRRSRSLRKPTGPPPATAAAGAAPSPGAADPTEVLPAARATAHGAEGLEGPEGPDGSAVDPDAVTEPIATGAPSRRRRRLLLGAAAAVLVLLAGLAAFALPGAEPDPASNAAGLPAAPAGAAPDPAPAVAPVCSPVTLVTADGGGRSPLDATVRDLERMRPRLATLDVPRPAPTTAPGSWSRVVRASLDATARKCPGTSLVVYAWSEGAAAATTALTAMDAEASPTVPRVAGVALVGNPARDTTRRVLPATTRGGGLTPTPPGSMPGLAASTVEVCAPADPVCSAPGPGTPDELATALRSPAHRDYARVPSGIGDRTVSAWLTDAARQAVDTVAPTAPVPGAAPGGVFGRPGAPGLLPGGSAPAAAGAALTALGLPVADPPGLIWRAARDGRLGFSTFRRNAFDEQSGSPSLVPGVRGAPALRFSVPAGGQRSEMQPRKADPREGQTQFVGYYGALASDFPIGNEDFQILLQWHHPGPDGSPPLTVEASHGELRLTGGDRRPFVASIGPARPGEAVNLVLQVTFSSDPSRGAVSVWRDGRLVVNGVRPPEGTLYAGDDSAYMKLGMYRRESAPGTATVFVNDVLVGSTLESVSPARRGLGG